MDVVAAGERELRARRAVGVVPPEGRRRPVGRIGHERARPVVRALLRDVEDAVRRAVDDRARGNRSREGRRRVGRARQGAGEILEVVMGGPVGDVEQLSRRGVEGRVPEMDAGRVVDRELPGEAQAVLGRLPAQACRDRLVGDAAVGDDRLPGGAAALAHDAQAGRLLELEALGRRLDGPDGVDLRVGRGLRLQVGHEARPDEDDPAVGGHADGHVSFEDLEIPVPLVEVDVGDAVVAAPVGARDGEVGHVGASDAELRCVLLDVADRQRDSVLRPRLRRRRRARDGNERDEHADEGQNRPDGLALHRSPLLTDR